MNPFGARYGAQAHKAVFIGLVLVGLLCLGTSAATVSTLATGLAAPIGAALDISDGRLYFVEYTAGTLKYLDIGSPAAAVTVASGFHHPEDVELDVSAGVAYVTTRDDPGTTGALWRVDLATGAKSLVTFNLDAPQQLALDLGTGRAYAVGFTGGRLWQIELSTGVKSVVASGLANPVGLVISVADNEAHVTEQAFTPRISTYDLSSGAHLSSIPLSTTAAPFFLSWMNAEEDALLLTRRGGSGSTVFGEVDRVDLLTGSVSTLYSWPTSSPSGVVAAPSGNGAYVTVGSTVVELSMVDYSNPMYGPLFLAVGHVPSTKITSSGPSSGQGYATTDPGFFFYVRNAPFGGTINLFGNLTSFADPAEYDATHYRIFVSKDGGPAIPVIHTWNVYKYNSSTHDHELTKIAPETDGWYRIPVESDGLYHPDLWQPPFLFMRWPSGDNGLYTFTIELWDETDPTRTITLPVSHNRLVLRVDKTPPIATLTTLYQQPCPSPSPCAPCSLAAASTYTTIDPCAIVSSAPNCYCFRITAQDVHQHLLSYSLRGYYGANQSVLIASDSYANHYSPSHPYWGGVVDAMIGKTATEGWSAPVNCAFTFYLSVWKRTINGYGYIIHRSFSKSYTINNVGLSCP